MTADDTISRFGQAWTRVTHKADGVVRVDVGGELDVAGAPGLREQLMSLHLAGARWVEVDLGELQFIDSAALGVLIGANRRLGRAGGGLRVIAASAPVEAVLQLTGAERALRPDPRGEG